MSNKYNLEQCVEQINLKLKLQGMDADFNERLLRHYVGEGVLPKADRDGRHAYYNDEHVDLACALRVQQRSGVNSKAFKTVVSTYPELLSGSSDAPKYESVGVAQNGDTARLRQDALATLRSVTGSARGASQPLVGAAALAVPESSFSSRVVAANAMLATEALQRKELVAKAPIWHRVEAADGMVVHFRQDVLREWSAEKHQELFNQISQLKDQL
jgi:DNA-binding transcriptional MerR regulator